MFKSYFKKKLIKCLVQLTWYYKYINNFYMYNSFKLKNYSLLKFLHQL